MAASVGPVGGYECELFVSSVPEELKCGLCKKVAREPSLTSCCGEHFCKLCIEQAIQDKKPCPSCEEAEFSVLGTNKRDHKKILALEVRCAMKDRGCDWTDTLEQLDAHLDANSDNCQYVDVKCPNECEQPVQKRHLPTHLAKQCTKRDFFCQYCNFKATYEVICNDHWPQCPFYPIPCPNGCEIMALERGDLDAHLMLCSLEEVECEFSQSGCKVKLVREEMERHLADNLQRHVLMMNKAGQEKMEQKERKIEELEAKLEEKDRQIQELQEEKDRQIQELREEKDRQVQELREEKDRQIQELREEKNRQIREQSQQVEGKMEKEQQIRDGKDQQLQKRDEEQQQLIQDTQGKVAQVEKQLTENVLQYKARIGNADAQFTMTGFQREKRRGRCWDSPPVYTHPGGYRIGIEVGPNGFGEAKGTHVSVHLRSTKGENDDYLKWPADCTITLQLLNQHQDQDHITVSRRLQWGKQTTAHLPLAVEYPVDYPVDYPIQRPAAVKYPVNYSVEYPAAGKHPVEYPIQRPAAVKYPVNYPVEYPAAVKHPVEYPIQRPAAVKHPVEYPAGVEYPVESHPIYRKAAGDRQIHRPAEVDCQVHRQAAVDRQIHRPAEVDCQIQTEVDRQIHRPAATLDNKFIDHKDLDWNAGRQTQYLKNDRLKWRITDIRVHSL